MSSPPIEVRPHPSKGRALHATKSFPPGAVIFPFTPLLLLPNVSSLTSVCSHCLRPGMPRLCSRCHAAAYCDAACQAAAWKTLHSRECKALTKTLRDEERRRSLPTPTRALIQALLWKEIANGLADLEGHVLEKRADGDEWRDIEMMAMAGCAFSGQGMGDQDIRRAAEMICKIQNNSFQRFDADLGVVGLFLEPTLAMANHSCIPNAAVQFIGRNALLIAENPIRAGDEIEIAYTFTTDPLPRRREALAHYKFTCQCLRCRDNLNVYQVAAISPCVNLNSQSLVPDVSKFREHPATSSTTKQDVINRHSESADHISNALAAIESPSERRKLLKSEYSKREPLVEEELWAVTPLPDILFRIYMLYSEEENYAFALTVACLVATACDPYQYPSPYHPIRLIGLFTVANLVSHTAAATASQTGSAAVPVPGKATLEQEIEETLREIDQVSLCQMLLIMIIQYLPSAEMGLTVKARAMLDDIEKLEGREKETSLIDEWRQDPSSEKSQAFFEFAVVKQVDALASLGKKVLRRDFES
ncbi:SET domain-containing protein [Trichoderma citrinoviride]|uniref:SET domain-containing protein n=1 Tax=Trichoderma citrinoviride TaxID=58853 RepID=A0A2T4BKS5_9HYPO|nr:SET domain-containing protein [Trichoderma citrinoviride]PTB69907.1 SET domain-containing protein [Trichoderma citrinoviride]